MTNVYDKQPCPPEQNQWVKFTLQPFTLLFMVSLFIIPMNKLKAEPLLTGITEPLYDLMLSLPVAGRVKQLSIKEGDHVKKGQVLLSLDKTLENLEVKRRELIVKDNALLKEVKRREKILKNQWLQARKLLASKSLPRKQVQDEHLLYLAAVAEREVLAMTKQREKIELELAEESVSRRILIAPIDGVVAKINFRMGESVTPHEAILQLVDASRARFIGNLMAGSQVILKKDDLVNLRIGSGENEVNREATIVFVSPITDASSGVVEIHAEFDNQDLAIRPGVSGELSTITRQTKEVDVEPRL